MVTIIAVLSERTWGFGKCKLIVLLLALLLESNARSDTVSFRLKPNEEVEHQLETVIDDFNLRNPCGYAHAGDQGAYFTRTITIENVGSEPLRNATLIINGKDFSRLEALARSLKLSSDPPTAARQFYNFWINHRAHATTGTLASREPVAVLNFWGYTFCGEDTNALEILFESLGIRSRKVPLNGHVAAEYFFENKWNVIDGDQNAVYLQLDNRTLASYSDIVDDPFLALRTKIFGKYAEMNAGFSAYNTSLFEFVDPREMKPRKPKTPQVAQPVQSLWPGEKLILHYDQPPQTAAGTTDLSQWGKIRESALGLVELQISAARAKGQTRTLEVATGFPITEVKNYSSGWSQSYATGEPAFSCEVPINAGTDEVMVLGHRARVGFPIFRKGRNTIELQSTGNVGMALVSVEFSPAPVDALPQVTIASKSSRFVDQSPLFKIEASAGADTMWWQISDEPAFHFVAPNFDSVRNFSDTIELDLLTDTFLQSDREYFLRAKIKRHGVWSEWSRPFRFQVRKPRAPEQALLARDTDAVHLRWNPPQPDANYMIFGSNRIDFLPELYSDVEISEMHNARVEESRPNKNLLMTVDGDTATVPPFRFYRIIARRGGAYSVPSTLIRLPHALSDGLPPATVLQTRWTTIRGAEYPNGYIDRYISRELPLENSQ